MILLLVIVVLFLSACSQQFVEVDKPIQKEQKTEPAQSKPSKVTIGFDGLVPTHTSWGNTLTLRWKVDTDIPYNTGHTAIHYGYEKVDDSNLNLNSYPYVTPPYSTSLPDIFESSFEPEFSGPLRLRVHVIVDGVDYWTKEETINID